MSTLSSPSSIRFSIGNLDLEAKPVITKSGGEAWKVVKFGKAFGTQNVSFSGSLGQNVSISATSLTKATAKLVRLDNTLKNKRMAAKLIVKVNGKPVALKLSIIATLDSDDAKLAVTATNVATSNGRRGRAKTPTTTLANLFG